MWRTKHYICKQSSEFRKQYYGPPRSRKLRPGNRLNFCTNSIETMDTPHPYTTHAWHIGVHTASKYRQQTRTFGSWSVSGIWRSIDADGDVGTISPRVCVCVCAVAHDCHMRHTCRGCRRCCRKQTRWTKTWMICYRVARNSLVSSLLFTQIHLRHRRRYTMHRYIMPFNLRWLELTHPSWTGVLMNTHALASVVCCYTRTNGSSQIR